VRSERRGSLRRSTVRKSVAITTCCGANDADVARRADAAGWKLEDLRRAGACGSPHEVAERLFEWRAVGAEVAYLQLLDPLDLDHIEYLGSALAPLV
jgi:alkanesulfonate monooxygenase SsuD/methylene tetrahydromethanopterin reductase-like flavin-dependent oxidoreductase (luciferase family)